MSASNLTPNACRCPELLLNKGRHLPGCPERPEFKVDFTSLAESKPAQETTTPGAPRLTVKLELAQLQPGDYEPPVCGVCGAVGGTLGHSVDALGNVHHPTPEGPIAAAVDMQANSPVYIGGAISRASDPKTSLDAAMRVDTQKVNDAILAHLFKFPALTTRELSGAINFDHCSVSPRMVPLEKARLVMRVGKRKQDTQRTAVTWDLTEAERERRAFNGRVQ